MKQAVKLSIEAIRVQLGLTRSEFADRLGINTDRYNRLATGESKLLATEFVKLQEVSGLPFEMIGTGI
jgi:transcriptional regulator with XRE-family HTH domain